MRGRLQRVMSTRFCSGMIGIHVHPNSYSDRWIQYCNEHAVPFRRLDCLATDVVAECEGLDAVLWHWAHADLANLLVARQVIASLEAAGLVVFPDTRTSWHYDDKVGQKYLLEAVGAPLIPSWVFTRKADALRWTETASWPKVFKLRSGAGSSNVRLVRSRSEALPLCRKAFGNGFAASPGYFADIGTRVRRTATVEDFRAKLGRAPRMILKAIAARRRLPRERGYVYFQEFLPGNAYDTRIAVIGERAFGFRRMNRRGDFRASGSGALLFDPEGIDYRCVQMAFEVTKRIGAQSLAFDFLFDLNHEPKIGEISYCYLASAVHACTGHWDLAGAWHEGHVWPEDAIIEDVLQACRAKGLRRQTES